MNRTAIRPTGHERMFDPHEIIVSKTDLKGVITYANSVFIRVAGYTEEELLGKPHNIIRHPDMPRCVFKLMWDTLATGEEIFAYVVNMCKNGDHYWVFAHVTPTFDHSGQIIGYHSSRRVPERSPVEKATQLYAQLKEKEESFSDRRRGMDAATEMLVAQLNQLGIAYDEFVFAI